jgi:ubiquitin-conjugating enzyme E2 G1
MLSRQLQQMQSDKDIPGISCGLVDNNVFEWEVMLMISDDVKLYGGKTNSPEGFLIWIHGIIH